MRFGRAVIWVGGMAASLAALSLNTVHVIDPGLHDSNIYARYWQDLHIAIGLWRTGFFPAWVAPRGAAPTAFTSADPQVKRPPRAAKVPAWKAWWTLPPEALDEFTESRLVRRFDDSGRPLMLGLAFRVLGGVAPLLLFWLGALVAMPVLTWSSLELFHERRLLAAVLLPLLVGSSPFVAEALALSYSAVGFYVAAALTLSAVAIPACGTRPLSVRGLLLRAVGGGVAFALCALGRSGSIALVPGFVCAYLIAARRATLGTHGVHRWRRLVMVGSLTLATFALPLLAARSMAGGLVRATFHAFGDSRPEPQRHAVWWGVWTGLGDFDRVKGYRWRDAAAAEAVAAADGPRITGEYYDPRAEEILRQAITRDIRGDPRWYAGILVRRFMATVTLAKLWPWGPASGTSVAPSTSWNEGRMDAYYALVTPVDWTGVGRVRWEWPVPLMLAPAWGLLAWAFVARVPGAVEARRDVALLAMLGGSTLILPIGISTASGIEPQVFALTYLVGAALCADRAAAIIHRWAGSGSTVQSTGRAAAIRHSASSRSTILP